MCTTLVVGRTRSATGHVILAHSEELGRNSAHRVCAVDAREAAPGERFPLHSGGGLEQAGRLIAEDLATQFMSFLEAGPEPQKAVPGAPPAGMAPSVPSQSGFQEFYGK